MAGKFKRDSTNTTSVNSADPVNAKAFCEGRDAQIAGISTNPHPVGSERNIAWQDGFNTVTPQGLRDNCSACIPIAVPNLVGSTLAAATAALVAVNLALGKVTLTTGPVTVQSPAATTKVQYQTTVNITLTS